MATLNNLPALLLCATALAACGKPIGLGAEVTPLVQVTVNVQVTGADTGLDASATSGLDGGPGAGAAGGAGPAGLDGGAGTPPLRLALVWGMQWQPEPFCLLAQTAPATLAPDPTQVAKIESVAQAGCRDNFGFVPLRVGADVPLVANGPTTLPILSLPSADEMVGDPAGRIAYASLVVYQDVKENGILYLGTPEQQRQQDQRNNDSCTDTYVGAGADTVYGASFISMTQPDRRVAYREGVFESSIDAGSPSVAFYPRAGCDAPPPSFSILSAGGFSVTDGLLSSVTGQLPLETSCGTASISDPVTIQLQDPSTLSQLACTANNAGGVTYYRKAPACSDEDPSTVLNQLTGGRAWVCANFPHLPGDDGGVPSGQQLVVAAPGPCVGTLHYTLRGCSNPDPSCLTDVTPTPSWWPCATSP